MLRYKSVLPLRGNQSQRKHRFIPHTDTPTGMVNIKLNVEYLIHTFVSFVHYLFIVYVMT
jgi:hypothetical protein